MLTWPLHDTQIRGESKWDVWERGTKGVGSMGGIHWTDSNTQERIIGNVQSILFYLRRKANHMSFFSVNKLLREKKQTQITDYYI